MSSGVIRPAVPADVPRIVALVESAYRGDASRVGWTTEADYLEGQRTDPEGVLDCITTPGQCLLVLEEGEALRASVHVKADPAAGCAWLGMFAVDPLAQGGGIGRRMVTAAEQHARSAYAAQRMCMYVIQLRQSLIDWYLRLGYAPTGESAPFPYGNPRFGLPKRDDLHFIVLDRALG